MGTLTTDKITHLLDAVQNGDREALNALFPLVYEELRVIAHHHRQKWSGDYTLNTTAIVHEAYIKLVDQSRISWNSKAHFFGVAAKAMRHILINYAEQRNAVKRGGDAKKLSLDEMRVMLGRWDGTLELEQAEALLLLEKALTALEEVSERQSKIVECRIFCGMTVEDTAEVLGVSTPTVKRGFAMAKAWLYRKMMEYYEEG